MSKIKVAAVSYLNTKPLLYGLEHSDVKNDIELTVDYPAQLVPKLQSGAIDIALLPVATIPLIEGARVVSDFGIAADGEVASVSIFSHVPIEQITSIYLDYQSRTSVRLARLLLENHWGNKVEYKQATEHYINYINDTTAGVIIGDRALKQEANFEYIYDLSAAWKTYTGLPFVFAAWVATKDLPTEFLQKFNQANAFGLEHIDAVVADNPFPYYDLKKYYTQNIHYYLNEDKKKGLHKFLELIQTSE